MNPEFRLIHSDTREIQVLAIKDISHTREIQVLAIKDISQQAIKSMSLE